MYPVMASYLGTETDAPSASWAETLALHFKDINSKQKEIRSRGATQLQLYVAEQAANAKGETFASFMADVNRYIKDMTKGTSPHAVLGGLLALGSLISLELDLGISIEQWASYLRVALMNSETLEVSQEASKQLGRLARIYDRVLPRDTLDAEVRESLEWLSPRQTLVSKRLTAVFVLAELFSNVPSAVAFEHVDSFIGLMDMSLQSPDLNLRNATVEVAKAAIRLIKMRSPETRHVYYSNILHVVESVFADKSSTPESVHGALLLLNVLMTETGTYMADKLPGLQEVLLSLRSVKNHFIRIALIKIIPRLAKFQVDKFAELYLDGWTSHLIAFTHPKKVERPAALESIAKLAILMDSRMKSQIDKIMPIINDTFAAHAKSKASSGMLCGEIFDCLAAMSQAVGAEVETYLVPILPVMFATEFTQKLIDTLATVARHVPTVKQVIQDNLLNTLSLILAKEPIMNVTPSPAVSGSGAAMFAAGSPFGKSGDGIVANVGQQQNHQQPISPRSPGSSGQFLMTPSGPQSSILALSGYSPRPKESPFPWMRTFVPPPKPAPSATNSNVPGVTEWSDSLNSDWEKDWFAYSTSPSSSNPSSAPSSLTTSIDIKSLLAQQSTSPIPGQNQHGQQQQQNGSYGGTNSSSTGSTTPNFGSAGNLKDSGSQEASIPRLLLALDTLASFDFDSEVTKHLIHRVVVNYLEHESLVVRKRSVIACSSLLLQQGELQLLRGYSSQMTSYVLSRLISAALTDTDSELRYTVLNALDTRFDYFLAQPTFLKQFFLFLYDMTFEIRELVIKILGRLAHRNPGYVYPTARTVFLELLNHVTDHDDPVKQETSARLLGLTFQQFPSLLLPYVESLCKMLLDVAKTSTKAEVVAHTLSALGDLAEVIGREMIPFLDVLMPIVLDAFQDQRVPLKREQALKALSQIIEGTGFVSTELLEKYPKLLDVILNKIKREEPGPGRIELVRLLGIIGALDPYKHKELQLAIMEAEDKVGAQHPAEVLMKGVTFNSSHYYPSVALTALLKLVRNPYGHHAPFQSMFIQAITSIFQALGVKCVPYLKHFIPLFSRLMAAQGDQFGFREQVFQQMCVVISIIKHYTRDYLPDFLGMVNEYWDIPKLFPSACGLLEEMALVLGDEFQVSLVKVVPKMLLVLRKDALHGYSRTVRILRSFEAFGELLDAHLPQILPAILRLVNDALMFLSAPYGAAGGNGMNQSNGSDKFDMNRSRSVGPGTSGLMSSTSTSGTMTVPFEVQQAAVICLAQLIMKHDVTKYTLTILHPLVKLLDCAPLNLVEIIMEALSNLAYALNQDFKVFMPIIHAVMTKHAIRSHRYAAVCHAILRNEPPPLIPSSLTTPSRPLSLSPMRPVAQATMPTAVTQTTLAHLPAATISPSHPSTATTNSSWGSGGSYSSVNSGSTTSTMGSDASYTHTTTSGGALHLSLPSAGGGGSGGNPSSSSHHHHQNHHQRGHSRSRSAGAPSDTSVLALAWDTSRCFTKADWAEWMRKLSLVLLSESSSASLRACAQAAKAHYPLARELFNAAFISCWSELTYDLQKELTSALEIALSSSSIPPEILQILLDLAEFMEHNEKPLPIDTKVLASLAMKCHAYAKALYYKETEYRKGVTTALVEDIISINYQLQLHEAAQGMLKEAQHTEGVMIKLSWYEKLQKWSTALEAYEKAAIESPNDVEITLGRMRCMHDLGKWDALSELCNETWASQKTGPKKVEIATLALSANLNLYRWERMELYADTLSTQSLDGCFYHALLCVHKNRVEQAKQFIEEARDVAAAELTALMGESYSRAYSIVVRIQQLAELEEISEYMKLDPQQHEEDRHKRQHILDLWKKRIQGVDRNVEVWQSLLSVRSLVEPPANNVLWWTKFGNLVRKSDRPNKSRQILSYLLLGHNRELAPGEPIPDTFPRVKISYLTLLYGAPATKNFAFTQMEQWVQTFSHPSCRVSTEDQARCYAKLARWQMAKYANVGALDESRVLQIQQTSKQAIEKATGWYRAWHIWALVNSRFVAHYEKVNPAKLDIFLLPAITGFVKAIHLTPYDNLQDILQLLTLWFRHGKKKEVDRAMGECFETVAIDKWLAVIPQLMARIHIPLRTVRQGIHRMLSTLGKHHPQALVFPVTVAKQSPFATRATAAQGIISSIRPFCSTLLDETLLVSSELIRVAILWKERWYKQLDEASRQYYIEKKTDAMAMTLQRLNEMLERGPETISEQTFVKVFGRDLSKAWESTKEFLKTNKVAAINTAWDLYGHVFRTIKRQLSQDFEKLHLKNVSPRLLAVDSMALAVPGTYAAKRPLVHIKSFNPILKVISSKQQPRKITIHGSDGLDYGFLLKGHEDLRQDERVMQLFGLVNTFLSLDSTTAKAHLSIRRFSVVPLSPNTGLIEWVPQCDTIHELIKQYRKAHNIPIDAEQIIITRMVPKPDVQAYYKLTPLQKLEVFQAALDGTSPFDLERAFYLNSKGSEDWLERRTTYTRSLAVISMVGYILGLGDRHPNNFLISRNNGKIMHIDFGDCFEVAMQREKYAERVPFRLTRMLVAAMEVSGTQGTFRSTCQSVMRVLRANADSIIAVLEAFVYDPLINWRLIPQNPESDAPSTFDTTNPAIGIARDVDAPLEDYVNADALDDGNATNVHGSNERGGGVGGDANDRGGAPAPTPQELPYPLETEVGDMHEALNAKAISVIQRVSDKLSGQDFAGRGTLDESAQVDLLFQQATSTENLATAFLGFCGYW